MKARTEITTLMREVGVPTHVIGHNMLRGALEMILVDNTLQRGLTTRLYPAVAEKFNTTPSRVERNMRHAMEGAVSRRSEEMVRLLGLNKPTLGEFLATLADELRVFRLTDATEGPDSQIADL